MSRRAISRGELGLNTKYPHAPVKVNWHLHAKAPEGFSSQREVLSFGFLYSMPEVRPRVGSNVSGRDSVTRTGEACQMTNIERVWETLCSFQTSSKEYVRPGWTAPTSKFDANCTKIVVDTSKHTRKPVSSAHSFQPFVEPISSGRNICPTSCSVDKGNTALSKTHSAVDIGRSCISVTNDTDWNDLYYFEELDDDEILKIISDAKAGFGFSSQPGTRKIEILGFRDSVVSAGVHSACNNGTGYSVVEPNENNHSLKLPHCSQVKICLEDRKQLSTGSGELNEKIFGFSPCGYDSSHQNRISLTKHDRSIMKSACNLSRNEGIRSYIETETLLSVDLVKTKGVSKNSSIHLNQNCMSSLSTLHTMGPPKQSDSDHKTGYIDGSKDERWKNEDFTWSRQLEVNNKRIFGNNSFRPFQKEVINATMCGQDVFLLMPTGGGKSLTYQLPAVICPGITLVVSPLVSLIQDQIMHLLQAKIPATCLTGNLDRFEQQEILEGLVSRKYKMLYVTPEKIARSGALLKHLEILYTRGSLARIVIDEAHCVSQWGHDFRPDYQDLGILKQKFARTPLLALTATATPSVEEDVMQALNLNNCIVFRQSFNRKNLWYSVAPKTKCCLDDIDNFIKENHFDESGIIYCLSRMDCERVAEKLQERGHNASFYHGSMDPKRRSCVQKDWSDNKIKIICATIAFGMGINKPDVRFVIHHSLPKSIEGYHQECGRAGRDGKKSSCMLYYTYNDYIRVMCILSEGITKKGYCMSSTLCNGTSINSGNVLKKNAENLLKMVSYCENNIECRRLLQLAHFGESFDPANCQRTCDNCSRTANWVEKDVTDIAKQLVELVRATGQKHPSSYILEVYRGSLNQLVKNNKHNQLEFHAAGRHLGKDVISKVIRHLVVHNYLAENITVRKNDTYSNVSSALKINNYMFHKLCSGNHKITMRLPVPTSKASKQTKPEPRSMKGSLEHKRAKFSPKAVTNKPEKQKQAPISEKICTALLNLRSILVEEEGDHVNNAYHILGLGTLSHISKRIPRTRRQLKSVSGLCRVRFSKYGDRILQTIKATIEEHRKQCASNSSSGSSNMIDISSSLSDAYSSESQSSIKRKVIDIDDADDYDDDEDFIKHTSRSTKRKMVIIGDDTSTSSLTMTDDWSIDAEVETSDEMVFEGLGSRANSSGCC